MEKLSTDELNRISVDDFKKSAKTPVVVLLNNVRSALNVGSVFRTCDAFRINKIFLCGISATPPNKEIRKTAIGAEESVDWVYFNNAVETAINLKQEGYTLIAVEQTHNSIKLEEIDKITSDKVALIFGNEVKGVDEELIELCDFCVEISQYGTKHSLNVSVCAGVVLYEFFKKYKIV